MGDRLEGWALELLGRADMFGTLATTAPDGAPHQVVIWYELRDGAIVVNSRVGRQWPSNLLRDPRYSFLVEDGYDWVSVKGRAEALPDQAQAQADIAAMARRYHAAEPEKAEQAIRENFSQQERISFLLHPAHVTEHPDDQ